MSCKFFQVWGNLGKICVIRGRQLATAHLQGCRHLVSHRRWVRPELRRNPTDVTGDYSISGSTSIKSPDPSQKKGNFNHFVGDLEVNKQFPITATQQNFKVDQVGNFATPRWGKIRRLHGKAGGWKLDPNPSVLARPFAARDQLLEKGKKLQLSRRKGSRITHLDALSFSSLSPPKLGNPILFKAFSRGGSFRPATISS